MDSGTARVEKYKSVEPAYVDQVIEIGMGIYTCSIPLDWRLEFLIFRLSFLVVRLVRDLYKERTLN